MNTRTSYQQTRLDGIAKGFGVDVEPAQHLTGQELDTWLDAAEDRLFDAGLRDLATMRVERERLAGMTVRERAEAHECN
jgi:hypothetical protein